MKRIAIVCVVSFALLGLPWLWPSAPAMERGLAAQGPVRKAHFIDVGQANTTLLEFKCGVVLIDAGAQDDEHVDGLVDFNTPDFDASPELDWTLEAMYVTHNHIDHNPGAPGRGAADRFNVKLD